MNVLAFLIGSAAMAGSVMAGGVEGCGIVVLDRHGEAALEMVGNSTVRIATRAAYVNSDSPMAIRTTGSATLDVPCMYIVGGASFGSHSGCTGSVVHTGLAYDDPISGARFPSTDTLQPLAAVNISGGSVNLSPGYYANGITVRGNATVTFAPGVYVVRGGFRVTAGSISAAGVCFIMMDGALDMAGTSSMLLTPPSSGDWTGLVIAQPASNSTDLNLSGGSQFVIHGAVYAPGARINMTGTSNAGPGPLMGDLVIAHRLRMTGNSEINIGGADMQAVVPPRSPLAD